MKYSNIQGFTKHLKGAAPENFAPVYVILSKDPFLRHTVIEQLINALLAGIAHPQLCKRSFEGPHLSLENIQGELDTLSLFSERKIIVIEQAEKLAKPVMAELGAYFKNPQRDFFLILSAASISAATNLYKNAEKIGVILELPEEKGAEKEKGMVEWILTQAAAKGKKIDVQIGQLLVKQLGTDPALLFHELEKLFCYVGDRQQITSQDVHAICVQVNLETIWQLGEALFRRDASAALQISKALCKEGLAFLTLLRQVRNQYQTDYQVCSILAAGGSRNEITALFPYMKGFILDRHIQLAQAYGMQRFKKGMIAIDEVEVMAKNSIMDNGLLADLLIIKLTT